MTHQTEPESFTATLTVDLTAPTDQDAQLERLITAVNTVAYVSAVTVDRTAARPRTDPAQLTPSPCCSGCGLALMYVAGVGWVPNSTGTTADGLTYCPPDPDRPTSALHNAVHRAAVPADRPPNRGIVRTRVVPSVGDPGKWQAQYSDPKLDGLWCDIGDAQSDRAQAERRERAYQTGAALAPELKDVQIRDRVQTYRFTVAGQDPLPAGRNPDGPPFLPHSVAVEWHDGELSVRVEGPRISAQGNLIHGSRLFTTYHQDDLTGSEIPGWVVNVVQVAVDTHSCDYWEWVTAGLPRRPAFGTRACTHGGDCKLHPDAKGLHNYDATAAEALEAVLAAVQIRHKFDADDVREIAARLGVEMRG